MKKTFFILTVLTLFTIGVNAQTKKDGTPDIRYKSNKETYSSPKYSTPSSTSTRPIYSGQTHTNSHGGFYLGSTNSHHKNGTYVNPSSNNNYGIHKKRN